MVSLYQVLKEYESDFLELREKFCLGGEIGYGSFPLHHHWEEDSMPFTALPVRINKGRLEVRMTAHWFSEWHDYESIEKSSKFMPGGKAFSIVRPVASEIGGYFISAYMNRGFIDKLIGEENRAFFEFFYKNLSYGDGETIFSARANELIKAGRVLPSAFTEMPREVFRGGLALMLGSILPKRGKLPERLGTVYAEIPHAESDDALAFCIHLDETENVRQFLEYWERMLEEQYFMYAGVLQINAESEMSERIVNKLNSLPEVIMSGGEFREFNLGRGKTQDKMMRCIRARKAFLDCLESL